MDYLLISNVFHFVLCICVVVFIRIMLETKSNSTSRIAFKKFVTVVIICLVADSFSYIFDNNPEPFAKIMNYSSMIMSIMATATTGYLWNHFFTILFHLPKKKIDYFLYALPMLILAGLLVWNAFSGIIFTIDDMGTYHRGNHYYLSFILQYVSFAQSIVRAVIVAEDMRTMRRENMRQGVILFGIIVLAFGFSQAFAGGYIALHCFGLTFGVFTIFVRFQDDQITHDRLTGLNNRRALDSYMVSRLQYYERGNQGSDRIFLLMMDINKFKSINDEYGHTEGDRVLCEVARALLEVGEIYKSKFFIARFGGDEFAAVYEAKGDIPVKRLALQIKNAVRERALELGLSFSISVGFAEYLGQGMDVESWIAEADRALYLDKNGG